MIGFVREKRDYSNRSRGCAACVSAFGLFALRGCALPRLLGGRGCVTRTSRPHGLIYFAPAAARRIFIRCSFIRRTSSPLWRVCRTARRLSVATAVQFGNVAIVG